jgi:hypothetical protein
MSFWVAGAVVGAGVIGAVGSNMAAGTQADAQTQAAQTQLGMFNTINQQEQPFIQGGYGALNQMMYGLGTPGSNLGASGTTSAAPSAAPGFTGQPALRPTSGQAIPPAGGFGPAGSNAPAGTGSGLTPGQFTSGFSPTDFLNNLDPGYQFQLQTGGQAVRNADTPGVGALSGPALKDLMGFNQGMASTGYQNAYNRFMNTNNTIFSRLSGVAGLGQNAASNVGTSGTQLGIGAGQAQAGAGASLASGIVGGTNALGGSAVPLAYLMSGQQGAPGAGSNVSDNSMSAMVSGGS